MVKKVWIICMLGLFILTPMFIARTTFSADFSWKMSTPFPPGDTANMGSDKFAKMVEDDSNGKVKITYYAGSLGSPKDAWDMVKSGTIQFTWTGDLYNPGRMPICAKIGLNIHCR